MSCKQTDYKRFSCYEEENGLFNSLCAFVAVIFG